MGFLDEIKRLARPVDDYDDEYDSDFTSKSTQKASAAEQQETFVQQSVQDKKNKIVNIHATTQLQVVVVEPDKFENAKEIADHLRDKRTVVLNLESTGKDVSRRILDFLSGVAYAQEGKIKKIAVSTYMITPYNVEILGDLMDELENNSQYF
ncbi:MAG: cell division protein SepF [Oscillospiraceae bacterium]|jgi:cell division inhibitor SepF|nr:cell division protein SepF [Oscillospiraceae bacterium]